jgi:acylphosphatase
MERTVQVRIEGRVQGVGYRAWVVRTAAQLSLAGFVRNEPDGSVAAGFTGPATDVDEMLTLLEIGPPAAAVTSVLVVADGGPPYQGFAVLR